MTSRPTCSTFTALNLKCPTAFCKGSLQEHFLVKEFSPLCLTRQPNPFRISISFHISINHQHRFGQNNSWIHCVTGEKSGKTFLHLTWWIMGTFQTDRWWVLFSFCRVWKDFILLFFTMIKWVFSVNGVLASLAKTAWWLLSGWDERIWLWKTSLQGCFLVMLSDTQNNNLSLRGKTRSSCGFTWTSLRDEVTAIKHHRITQTPNKKTPEFHFSLIYKALLNILHIH